MSKVANPQVSFLLPHRGESQIGNEWKKLRSALQDHSAVQRRSLGRNPNPPFPPPPMEFRFRAVDRRPRRSSSSSASDSSAARFPHSRGGYFRAQGMRAAPFCGGPPPPPPPPFEWEAAARRERIIRQEVERRLIEEEVRRELELERDLALSRGLHGGFGPDPFFVPDRFMPPPPPMHPHAPPPPMPMHPHAPPPRPFEEFGAWQGFGRLGPRRHAGFGQTMPLLGEERRWSPPPPKYKLELREIEPCESSEVLPSETKVSGMKRKADAIAATTEPRKVQKPAQDWSCVLCHVSATSEAGLNEHLEGKKHKAKLAQSGAIKVINDDKNSIQATTGNKNDTGHSDAPKKICIQVDGAMYEVLQKNNYLWCERCRVRCDSNVTMAGHLRGKKHSELNKVWTSIKALRMNTKTKEGLASTSESKVNENSYTEIPVEIKKEDTGMAIEVDENDPIENPVEIKKQGTDMATTGDENVPIKIPVEINKEDTDMATEVHENGPVETPMEIKKEGTDMTTDVTQLVPREV